MTTYVLGLIVSINDDRRLATPLGNLDGSNLLLEPAGLLGGVGLLV
jgi:hypothetical protein